MSDILVTNPEWHSTEHQKLQLVSLPTATTTSTLPTTGLRANARRFRNGYEWWWNGTRWLNGPHYSTFELSTTATTYPLTATTAYLFKLSFPDSAYSIYVESVQMTNSQLASFDATNNWTIQLYGDSSAGVATAIGSSVSTYHSGMTATTVYHDPITINVAVASTAALPFHLDYTKIGASGNLFYIPPIMKYWLIGV